MLRQDGFILCLLSVMLCLGGMGCKDSQNPETPSPIVHRWSISKRTASFPGNPSLNFTETGAASDYLEFRNNDSVYSYITLYLPFSIDTASYIISSNRITVHDTRQYGIVFQHQDNNGNIVQTTDIDIVYVTDSTMQLRFPTMASVVSGGNTTYYPGTLTYDLNR